MDAAGRLRMVPLDSQATTMHHLLLFLLSVAFLVVVIAVAVLIALQVRASWRKARGR